MKVEADNYTHEFHHLSENEIFFDRKQSYRPNYKEIDVYGSFWSFLLSSLPNNSVSIKINEQEVPIQGNIGLFMPAHSIVHWRIQTPHLHWFAYSNRLLAPNTFPKEPTIYPLDTLPSEISPAWIYQHIATAQNARTLPLVHSNLYAKKLKAALDREFKMNTSLHDYAKRAGISKEWLIKYFKKSYGLTPIDYRNKKRVMETLFSLHVSHEKIIDLAHNVGFNDLKHFNKLFKKAISIPPSQFLPR